MTTLSVAWCIDTLEHSRRVATRERNRLASQLSFAGWLQRTWNVAFFTGASQRVRSMLYGGQAL